jgi:hypothetical protein
VEGLAGVFLFCPAEAGTAAGEAGAAAAAGFFAETAGCAAGDAGALFLGVAPVEAEGEAWGCCFAAFAGVGAAAGTDSSASCRFLPAVAFDVPTAGSLLATFAGVACTFGDTGAAATAPVCFFALFDVAVASECELCAADLAGVAALALALFFALLAGVDIRAEG